MLKGMTGFAQGASRFKDGWLHLEVRSLNHRFFECLVHLPDGLGAIEDLIKGNIRAKINRGRITASLSITNSRPKVLVNYGLANNYMRALKQLNQKLKLENNLSLSQIMNMPGILSLERIEPAPELVGIIKELVNRTLAKLVASRDREGRALDIDIHRRIATIKKEADRIKGFTRALIAKKQKDLPEEEYSLFLKNTDISEEMTRIGYHLKNFQATLKKTASYAKELDFIAQEIQREANTISAKAQDARVSSAVVVIKGAVDKIREQLQNAE